MPLEQDIDLNKVPYIKGNQIIHNQYGITDGRYVMRKARGMWQTISEWWNHHD